MNGAHGRCRRTNDSGEERNTQQGERQRNKGNQRSAQPDQAAGGTTVPYLLGGFNGSNAAPQGDIKEIDAVADGGLVIIGIGMGTVKAISGTNGFHGHGSAGGSSYGLLTGEGCSAGIAVHKIGAGGNIGSTAGAVGKLKAAGVLAGILHAPQKSGEFIVGTLNGADIDRCGKQREYAVFCGNAIVGQVVDVADIVIITGEYHRTGQHDSGVHRRTVGGVSCGCLIGACRNCFVIGYSIGCLPFGIGKISALLDGSGTHRVTEHADLGQVDEVIVFELLKGGIASEVGGVVFHVPHFRLFVAIGRQGAFTMAVHIQRHYHIPAAAQFNGVRLHGILAGGIAVAQQDCRSRGFRSSCFRDKELCVAGGADIGGKCQLLGAD